MRWKKQKRTLVVILLLAVSLPASVYAQSSTNYKVEETFFGTGGEVDMNSTNYNAHGSAGSLGVGSSSSDNFDAEAGFVTPNAPFLEMIVNTSSLDLGNLSASSTSSGSATFSVRSYLSSTYSVMTLSQAPTSEGGAQLDPMTSTAAAAAGTEQFGINLVDNATPDVGAIPANVPDDSFADGEAASGYATADQFKYGVGDIIARSAKTAGNQAVGRTNYTISYIANISGITPAGLYTMNHDLVVVATY